MVQQNLRSVALWLAYAIILMAPGAAWTGEFIDPHAGYRVKVNDVDAWTSQLTNTPGVTSRLCLARQSPRLILCFQALHENLAAISAADLAQGFVNGVAQSLGVDAPGELMPQSFAELSGFSQRLILPPPAELSDVWMFAGVGPSGQVQTAVAFSAPGERDRTRSQVHAIVNAVRFDGDRS